MLLGKTMRSDQDRKQNKHYAQTTTHNTKTINKNRANDN